jgi:endonuclease/exonuclease/phosphatase family metal-dependent hydrolase
MVRVATYNIRHCRGMDGRVDVVRTADVIASIGADFVGLQEVDRRRVRSGGVDQPAHLAELLGLTIRFWPTVADHDGEYGLAVAAVEEVDADFIELPRGGGAERRGALIARWRGITAIAVHLAKEARARRGQVRALAEVAAATPPPVLVLGDLNSPRRALRPLAGSGFDLGPRLTTRYSRRLPQIDYVLAGPGLALKAAWTVESAASDHLPVVAEVEPA